MHPTSPTNTMFVLGRDGQTKAFSKQFLQNQFRQGNLSEKLLVAGSLESANRHEFHPLFTCDWFYVEDSPPPKQQKDLGREDSPSPPAAHATSQPTPPQAHQSSPVRSVPVQPSLMRQGSLGRLKPKFPNITSSSRILSSENAKIGLSRVLDHVPAMEEDDIPLANYSLDFLTLLQAEYAFHSKDSNLAASTSGKQFSQDVLQAEIDFYQNMLLALTNGRYSPIVLAQAFQHHHALALEANTAFLQANKPAQRLPPESAEDKDFVYFEGILQKRSNNVMRDWKRRYFQIRRNHLVYLKHPQREPIVVCELALCTVRSKDLPGHSSLTFEVVSNTRRSLLLMGETVGEKDLWIAALRRGIERSLVGGGGDPLFAPPIMSSAMSPRSGECLTCFDCDMPLEQANWVSINLGIYLCISCSGIHRSLGTHVSKVRSLLLDTLSPVQLDILKRLGNDMMRKIYIEHPVGLMSDMPYVCRDKYVLKKYLDTGMSEEEQESALERAIQKDKLHKVARFVAHSKPPFMLSSATTALHLAAQFGSEATCEFLLLNGADLGGMDLEMRTPSDVAVERGNVKAQQVFRNWAASLSVLKQPPAIVGGEEDV
ncbi:hypothetical protein BASA81_012375 [Batrachochytrium salamandrivorans]|nr:hypothetical protein BASA81_012375 [Batrachochytrium salamandrivorans]